MAPHLTPAELDAIVQDVAHHRTAAEIHARIAAARGASGTPAPQIWAVRRAARGVTHKRSAMETRGRKKALTAAQVKRLNASRVKLVKQAGAQREVTYKDIMRKARVKVHRTTAARCLAPMGVKWRRLREKPPRTAEHEEARVQVCREWSRKRKTFWTNTVDLIIDCKKFPAPTTAPSRKRLRQQHVRGALRTRKEGLAAGCVKPNARKHKFNPGGQVHILAGVCGDRVVVWEEIHGRWNARAATAMYEGPILKTLKRRRPGKRAWIVMEDNDPAGFKSTAAQRAKAEHGIRTLDQPAYSPDLNPLDFSLWSAVQQKVLAEAPSGRESVAAFKARLRRTALRLPASLVKKAVENIQARAVAVLNANGGNIQAD